MWYARFHPSMINNKEIYPHPIGTYEELFLAKFLGINPFNWQVVGFLLRILDSIAVSLMMLGITKSKKVAFFTGLIFASSVGGLQSVDWMAAQATALVIPLLCLGIYFWVTKKGYLLALILLLASIIADPARGFFGSLVVILWEVLLFIQNPKRLVEYVMRVFIFSIVLLTTFFILRYFFYTNSISIGYNLDLVLAKPVASLDNFLTIIGNLLTGWLIPIPEDAFSISTNNIFGKLAGYLFLLQTIFLVFHFLRKKSETCKILLFFSVWIPLFFFPNWLLSSQEMIGYGWILGTTHRYLALSAVGLACWLGMIISLLKNRYQRVAIVVIVISGNIFMANLILAKESVYRSRAITEPMWEKIEKDIPVGEENSLFTFQSEDKTRLNQLAQAAISFGFRRNIQDLKKLPKSTVDYQLVKALLCGQEADRPKIPLSHFHVWQVTGNTLENVSEKAREDYSRLNCDIRY